MSPARENAELAKELPRLVSSNKVEGTLVLSRDSDRLGTVAAFLIDRFSGQVDYVVASMGGVLGIGSSYHPIPWRLLRYEAAPNGYVISVDKGVLNGAPSFKSGSEPVFDDVYSARILSYFGYGSAS
ncbi:MAG: PRC-barrel domain-containing protein [Janthinobacterium lividum]